jgi:nitrogenase cofactor biosynthesis protein NifB
MSCHKSIYSKKPIIKKSNSQKIIDKTNTHPCFNYEAIGYGRMHLPVAPKCNIQCNYCNRKFDCRNESRPGVSSEVLSPIKAFEKYKKVKEEMPYISVVGIAGPGDPLANYEETKETLRLIREYDKDVTFCLSTNGLKLTKYADELIELGVSHITVTINTIYEDIAAKIYRYINYNGKKYFGLEGGKMLLKKQWEAIDYLKDKDVITKVNIVHIKGINDNHIEEIVKKAKKRGVCITNIMPLIPIKDTYFEKVPAASQKEINSIRHKCNEILPQMLHCNQCRADAVGTLERKCSDEKIG